MGDEWATSTPFQYFTDHHGELGRLVTENRQREFGDWAALRDDTQRVQLPDPQDAAVFERSRLRWPERDGDVGASTLRWHRALLAFRREERALRWADGAQQRAIALDEDTIALRRFRAGAAAVLVVVRLRGAGTVEVNTHDLEASAERWRPILSMDGVTQLASQDTGLRFLFEHPAAIVLRAG